MGSKVSYVSPCKHGVIAYTCKYWNISVVSEVFIEIFQHNQKYDTLPPIIPCTHKLKAGIALLPVVIINVIFLISYRILNVLFTFYWKKTKMHNYSIFGSYHSYVSFAACQLQQHLGFDCKDNVNKERAHSSSSVFKISMNKYSNHWHFII
jgi:hypothetical protein